MATPDLPGAKTAFHSSSQCLWGPDCHTVGLSLCTRAPQDEKYSYKAVITLGLVLCTGQCVGGEAEREPSSIIIPGMSFSKYHNRYCSSLITLSSLISWVVQWGRMLPSSLQGSTSKTGFLVLCAGDGEIIPGSAAAGAGEGEFRGNGVTANGSLGWLLCLQTALSWDPCWEVRSRMFGSHSPVYCRLKITLWFQTQPLPTQHPGAHRHPRTAADVGP